MCVFCSYLGVAEVIQLNAFVYKCVCDSFLYLLGVVFVCNCLFLNDFSTRIEFFVVYVSWF